MTPRKIVFTREEVLKTAFYIAQKHGMQAVTARSVAGALKASVAPVYSCFASMDDLRLEIINKTVELLEEYSEKPYTERIFLNIGVGLALFARDQKLLFRALFLESNKYREAVEGLSVTFNQQMKKDPRFASMPDADRTELLNKMWTYTLGLAAQINMELIKENSQEFIINNLLNVGADIIGAALSRLKK